MIRTAAAVLFAALCILLVQPFLILYTALTGNSDPMYWSAMAAVRFIDRITGLQVRVEGLKNIPAGVCVFAANHVSNADPLVFIPFIPRHVAILIKREVFRIPILGFGMRQARFIPLNRQSRESGTESVETAVRYIRQGFSFVMFPEGTRSPDGRLRPFRKGAFAIPIRAGVPVVPVSISGTQGIMPKGSSIIRPGVATLHFGPPIDASQFALDQRAELARQVEALVSAALPPEQQPLASA